MNWFRLVLLVKEQRKKIGTKTETTVHRWQLTVDRQRQKTANGKEQMANKKRKKTRQKDKQQSIVDSP